ncbi:conjugal transfer protein TraF [Vibrio navarrensis]|uniref:Conjugal transfer protein TraF n=1 Tax=Vibrio navarrensis TaxID=29495 RepID=A0AAI9G8R8_9VIBR|nr:conjugal transfer protein TraF [Vibrio navarrensis]EJL6399316.1 conjugal transfer protein TraF [Vibrio navarrensis]EJL6565516.1 conjugal transfer protein TraF [Vibrio navarrensis]ELN6932075.1 conjugal transfer protein TraF [Vibrio navarrensis]MBE4618951.1 conjugal transfer protein TraF [Vibrio navarrensis]
MKMKNRYLAATIAALCGSSVANAANYAIEARSDAMGGVGTVSATYLTAPFFNPALTAVYRRNDDAGMIIPSFGISYNDPDKLVDQIEELGDLIAASDPGVVDALNNINGDQLDFEIGGVVAFGIPNKFLSATIYGKAYTESFVTPTIAPGPDPDNSYVQAVTVAVTEVGVSLGKYQTFLNQHMAFGVTPKLQRVYTYSYAATFSGYDSGDLRENETAETMFNLDAGALWFYGPFRIGVAAKNLVGRDIKTKEYTFNGTSPATTITSYEYSMRPLYTVGAGIVSDYFTLSVDYDLNEEKKFSAFDDNTQMLRAGIEIDLLRQLQLRGGYMKNMARDTDDTITAGIGISPLNLFELDISARYTNENAMGASINFLATY